MDDAHVCEICGKPATVHFTQIIGKQTNKVHLCGECAKDKGITGAGESSLAGLLASHLAHAFPKALPEIPGPLTCPDCGYTAALIKKNGLLGCPTCYETFEKQLEPLIEGLHRGSQHAGKGLRSSASTKGQKRELKELQAALDVAIHDERYEDAAKLRDEIRALEKELAKGPKDEA